MSFNDIENNQDKNNFINRYGVNFTNQTYVVNPAIGREKELKELSLTLLTPDKSAILTGKPGIGKTAIVEGLAYLIQRNEVPDALKGYTIIKVDTQALIGTVKETGDSRVQTLIDEITDNEKYILFVDEIHTLINATSDSALDFAQMFKTGLGRGDLKVIGATTSDEYERYILRDKAFTRRFQRIEIAEPDVELTVKIVTGVIPRIENSTGIKMGYTPFIQEKLARFVTELTTEYNRVYETAGRYPDVAISLFSNAFSEALFKNKEVVTASDVRSAIEHTKAVYPDVIKKYLVMFDDTFSDLLEENDKNDKINIFDQLRDNENIHSNDNTINEDVNYDLNTVENSVINDEKSSGISDSSLNEQTVNSNLKDDTLNKEDNFSNIKRVINVENKPSKFENTRKEENDKITDVKQINDIYDRIINPFESLREDRHDNN